MWRRVVAGPGVTCPKSRVKGVILAALDQESSLLVLPGPLPLWLMGGVRDQVVEHDVGDLALQGPAGLALGLVLLELAQVVIASRTAVGDLGHGDDVDGVVELAVARRLRR